MERDKEYTIWYKKDGEWYSDKKLDYYINTIKQQQKEIEEKDKLILYMKEKLNNISFEVETLWRKIEKVEKQ